MINSRTFFSGIHPETLPSTSNVCANSVGALVHFHFRSNQSSASAIKVNQVEDATDSSDSIRLQFRHADAMFTWFSRTPKTALNCKDDPRPQSCYSLSRSRAVTRLVDLRKITISLIVNPRRTPCDTTQQVIRSRLVALNRDLREEPG